MPFDVRFACALMGLFVACAGLKDDLARTQSDLENTQIELARSHTQQDTLRTENETCKARISTLQRDVQRLTSRIETLANKRGLTAGELAVLRAQKAEQETELQAYRELFERLEALVGAGTVNVVFRKGRMTLTLNNALLFDSGRAKLRSEARPLVTAVTVALRSAAPDRDFLVADHTDNVPTNTARYRNNWELSAARATAVVDAMVKSGFPPARLGAASFGEHDPAADNETPKGRKENRRVEIILMPASADAPDPQTLKRIRQASQAPDPSPSIAPPT